MAKSGDESSTPSAPTELLDMADAALEEFFSIARARAAGQAAPPAQPSMQPPSPSAPAAAQQLPAGPQMLHGETAGPQQPAANSAAVTEHLLDRSMGMPPPPVPPRTVCVLLPLADLPCNLESDFGKGFH